MIINDTLVNQLISNPVFKTDTRAIFFLLQNPEPVSADDIAAATGLSRKCANKATKRLTAAGLIIPGLPEARKRSFDVTGGEPIEPSAATEGTTGESSGTFTERFNRLESMIGTLKDTLGAGLNPAHINDGQNEIEKASFLSCVENIVPISGQNETRLMPAPAPDETAATKQAGSEPETGQEVTGIMPVCSQVDEGKNIQDKREPENIPKGTIGTEYGTNEPQKDTINDELDDAITRAGARLAAFKSSFFVKRKAKQLFRYLFSREYKRGVQGAVWRECASHVHGYGRSGYDGAP